jgi:hypothetical protein
MGMKVIDASGFTRTTGQDRTTRFSTFASDHGINRGPDSFILRAADGKQHLFRLVETKLDDEGDVKSWNYRNNFYGDKVEVVLFND